MIEAQYPRINRAFSIIAHSHSYVELRKGVWNSFSYYMQDETESGKLYEIIKSLNGEVSIADVAKLADLSVNQVREIVDILNKNGLLETESCSAIDFYLDSVKPLVTKNKVLSKDVLLLGDQVISVDIKRHLSDFSLEHDVDIFCEKRNLRELFIGDDPAWVYDEVKKKEFVEKFSSWKNYFIIFTTKNLDPLLLQYFNYVAIELGLSWVFAAIDGPMLFIGPTFTQNETACFECFEKRVVMNLGNSSNYIEYKKSLACSYDTNQASDTTLSVTRGLLATHVSLEAINYILTGSNHTVSKALCIYLPTMEIVFNEVMKLSGCSACGVLVNSPLRQMNFDIDYLLTEAEHEIGSTTRLSILKYENTTSGKSHI